MPIAPAAPSPGFGMSFIPAVSEIPAAVSTMARTSTRYWLTGLVRSGMWSSKNWIRMLHIKLVASWKHCTGWKSLRSSSRCIRIKTR